MGILTPFTSPRDIRWQGRLHHHHTIWLIKNIILILFTILIIVEYALFKSYWYDKRSYTHKDWKYAPYHFWLRIGIAYIPDVLLTVVSAVLIANQNHRSTYSFHPVFALSSALIVWALYISVCWMNPLFAASNEIAFHNDDVWYQLAYAETGFQGVICLLYIVLIVYSCVAVDKWRMGKRVGAASVKMGRVGGDAERGEGGERV